MDKIFLPIAVLFFNVYSGQFKTQKKNNENTSFHNGPITISHRRPITENNVVTVSDIHQLRALITK